MIKLKLILLLFSISCGKGTRNLNTPSYLKGTFKVPYDLANPEAVLTLDPSLKEISGLTFSQFEGKLAAVNDEKAIVYYLDKNTGEILKTSDFGKSDDYEGLAAVGDSIYIIESNGNIKILNERIGKKVDEFGSDLSKQQDIEGLCLNKNENALYIAAKGASLGGSATKKVKSIYKLDWKSRDMYLNPVFYIHLSKMAKSMQAFDLPDSPFEKSRFAQRLKDFAPSGICFHPNGKDIYIVSARGSILLILNKQGEAKSISFLRTDLHPQVEGICFDNQGNLYLANEGKYGKGTLLKYSADL